MVSGRVPVDLMMLDRIISEVEQACPDPGLSPAELANAAKLYEYAAYCGKRDVIRWLRDYQRRLSEGVK